MCDDGVVVLHDVGARRTNKNKPEENFGENSFWPKSRLGNHYVTMHCTDRFATTTYFCHMISISLWHLKKMIQDKGHRCTGGQFQRHLAGGDGRSFSKVGVVIPPKWMVKIMENPIRMGWFGGVYHPYFLETPYEGAWNVSSVGLFGKTMFFLIEAIVSMVYSVAHLSLDFAMQLLWIRNPGEPKPKHLYALFLFFYPSIK